MATQTTYTPDFTKLLNGMKTPADFFKAFGEFKMPGIDVDSLMASQQRNFETITKVNQAVAEGVQAVAKREAAIFQSAVEEMNEATKTLLDAPTPEERTTKQVEMFKKSFLKAVADSRELFDMTAKWQQEVSTVMAKRFVEGLDEFTSTVAKPAAAAASK
ncbi:MAG: phasin [Rhodospirillaceae bacterium]|nr:phasin [Rhodospirillaceae bacterium]